MSFVSVESGAACGMRDSRIPSMMVAVPASKQRYNDCRDQVFIDAARIDRKFAKKLRQARAKLKLSPSALARRCKVSVEVIETAESRPWDISFGNLILISKGLGKNLADCLDDESVVIYSGVRYE